MIIGIVPAYNEAAAIGGLLEDLGETLETLDPEWKVAVVNDGSTDETARVLQSFQGNPHVFCLTHEANRGVDAAFRTGFTWALKQGKPGDVLLTLEGDGTSDLAILPPMLERLRKNADVVTASCYGPGGKVVGDPFLRLVMSLGVNWLLKILYPIPRVYTYTSFYRVYRMEAVQRTFDRFGERSIEAEGFVCMADFLLKLRRVKARIAEVPIILVSREEPGESKLRVGKTILGYLRLFLHNVPWV